MADIQHPKDGQNPNDLMVALPLLVKQIANREAEFTDLISALSPVISEHFPLSPQVALELSLAMSDIEQLALHEDQLHALVNQHSAAKLAVSLNGVILSCNLAA